MTMSIIRLSLFWKKIQRQKAWAQRSYAGEKTDAPGSDDLAGAQKLFQGIHLIGVNIRRHWNKKYIESDYLFFYSARTYVLPWKPDSHTGTI